VDENKTRLIQSVEFKIQVPDGEPLVNLIEASPFETTTHGLEKCIIEISIIDFMGCKHDAVINLEESVEEIKNFTIQRSNIVFGEGLRMTDVEEDVNELGMHGLLGVGKDWKAPYLVTFCDKEARKGYNTMKAHEYMEDPETLLLKIKQLAELIQMSSHCVAYTGAGISTASGINDYATQSKNSITKGEKKKKVSMLGAQPTFAHYVMAALYKAGFLKHWVQQNHDGLPQKSGFPQQALNEIHGSWFDPSNPVVPMEGTLRGDLFQWIQEEENYSDLVIAMGTSLCGMNSDRMVKTPGKKFINEGQGLGAVIIGFQRTAMDEYASIRIFARIDEVMLLLALEMNLPVKFTPYTPDVPEESRVEEHVFMVPYNTNGELNELDPNEKIQWNLNVGAKLKLTGGPGVGFEGFVVSTPEMVESENSYVLQFPCTREKSQEFGKISSHYCLGTWFIEAACKGLIPLLPVINID